MHLGPATPSRVPGLFKVLVAVDYQGHRSGLDEVAEAEKGLLPLTGDLCEVAADAAKAALVQMPNSFAAEAGTAHKSDPVHGAQVFADGLPSDAKAMGEFGDGSGATIAEAQNEAQAGFVPQDSKEGRRIRQSG